MSSNLSSACAILAAAAVAFSAATAAEFPFTARQVEAYPEQIARLLAMARNAEKSSWSTTQYGRFQNAGYRYGDKQEAEDIISYVSAPDEVKDYQIDQGDGYRTEVAIIWRGSTVVERKYTRHTFVNGIKARVRIIHETVNPDGAKAYEFSFFALHALPSMQDKVKFDVTPDGMNDWLAARGRKLSFDAAHPEQPCELDDMVKVPDADLEKYSLSLHYYDDQGRPIDILYLWGLAIFPAPNLPGCPERRVFHATRPLRGELHEMKMAYFRAFLASENG